MVLHLFSSLDFGTESIDCYFYINKVGRAKGLTEADLPQIVKE